MFKSSLVRGLLGALLACLAVPAALADETDIRKSLEVMFHGTKIDAVRKLGILGLYEVQVGPDLVYTDEKGSYVILGDILDIKERRNLTEERKAKLAQIKWSDLPLDLAVKTVRGNGKRVFATFEDPNCVYCKRLAKELIGMNDVTIYTFLYPILAPDSTDKAKAIWCSADRSKAWTDWMVNGALPKAADCKNPIDKVTALGQKLNVRGTPTIIFADGNRISSYLPKAKLEEILDKVGSAK